MGTGRAYALGFAIVVALSIVGVPAAAADTLPAGDYIVTLKDAPAATYQGETSGYASTAVRNGARLDATQPAVAKYSGFLAARQRSLTSAVGITPLYSYTIAYNGFAARLSSSQAARLAKSSDVASVVPDQSFTVADAPVGADRTSAVAAAPTTALTDGGAGIVIGDIDTGIAPENPSFAAAPLETQPRSDEPWLDGSTVRFAKANGAQFTSTEIPETTAGQWGPADYTQKIVAARYFVAGFGAQNIGTPADQEYLSPRDGSGHGSHTASTAAGNALVEATADGVDEGPISGVAPDAKIAVYKACWSDARPATTTGDTCFVTDTLAAVEQAVADGVDVINYSIGGNGDTSFGIMDAAFLNASSAGVFVVTAAGNDGDAASTVEGVAPWETTVGAVDSSGVPAAFSGRGPSLADGGDILKPDLAAPGVSVLAALANAQGASPRFGYLSGTSMAAPQVAGLAARYLAARPSATPAEVKSVLMTSATGGIKPFAEGAGEIDTDAFLEPGFYYPAGLDNWKSFLVGSGDNTDTGGTVEPSGFFDGVIGTDPSELNQASIAIGDLAGTHTVTRTVTSTSPTDVIYTASADLPGIQVAVSPSTLHFTAAGQTLQYTVSLTNENTPPGGWATGSLSWTSNQSPASVVREPMAVRATSVQVQPIVAATGRSGSVALSLTASTTGSVPVGVVGVAVGQLGANPDDAALPYSGIARTADAASDPFPYRYVTRVEPGTALAEFDVAPTHADAGTDLDLAVYYAPDAAALAAGRYTAVATSATSKASESVRVDDPDAGFYISFVAPYATPAAGIPFRVVSYLVDPAVRLATGTVTVDTATVPVTAAVATSFPVRWSGLPAGKQYLAAVGYGTVAAPTVVKLDSSVADWVPPAISSARVGAVATVSTGDWSRSPVATSYQWTANGAVIDGATSPSFAVPAALLGATLGVTVTASSGADPAASASAPGVVVGGDPVNLDAPPDGPPLTALPGVAASPKHSSRTTITRSDPTITTGVKERVTVRVYVSGSGKRVGTVTVHYGSKTRRVVLHSTDNGRVVVTLPKLARGHYAVSAAFAATATVRGSASTRKSLVVRR